jgi:4-hydroxybenzoate polyprenyltransferase
VTGLADMAELVRAPAALSVPGDVLAGAAAAGTLGPAAAGLCAASVCLYWAGMAANDWADRELDAAERPERPIPSGRVPAGTALRTATALTAAGLAAAGLAGGRRALAAAVPLAGLVWWYDTGLKPTAAGPAAMAACRGLDVLLGASGGAWRRAAVPALTVAAHTYTVTALSRREVSGGGPALPAATLAGTAAVTSVPAVAAARRPARAAPQVTAAARRAAAAGDAAAGQGQAAARPAVAGSWGRVLPGVLAGWYAANYGLPQVTALAEPSAGNMRAAVGAGITGLPVLQGALIARAGGRRAAIAVAAAAPLGRRLARWLPAT